MKCSFVITMLPCQKFSIINIWIQVTMHWRPQYVSRNAQISSTSFCQEEYQYRKWLPNQPHPIILDTPYSVLFTHSFPHETVWLVSHYACEQKYTLSLSLFWSIKKVKQHMHFNVQKLQHKHSWISISHVLQIPSFIKRNSQHTHGLG